MNIHFIAIGGSAMHNLAIALHNKGYQVTGSDDTIHDPSKSRLEKKGLLPKEFGWFPEKITEQLDVIILGMHACIPRIMTSNCSVIFSGNQPNSLGKSPFFSKRDLEGSCMVSSLPVT